MPYALNRGTQIYWEEEGAGDPLLMITGLSFTLAMWGELRGMMAQYFRTVVFDNRCVGKSSVPRAPFTIEHMARDALAVLDDSGVEKAAVLGLSMGGMVAQEFALRHPERITRLVLACTHCGGFKAVLADFEVLRALAFPFIRRQARLEAIVPFIYDPHTPRERIERDLAIIRQNAPGNFGYFQQLTAIARWHSYERLPQIHVPTLVIHGMTDRLVPPANAFILANRIPGAQLKLIPNASHVFPTDQPEITCDSLVSFLHGAVESKST